jgi:hypothetical protein
MNNRKQKIYSLLDSLSQKELEDYMKDRKLNKKAREMLELINRYKEGKPNHFVKISNSIAGNLNDIICKYHKLGQAYTIAFVLEYFYNQKYKLADLKTCMKETMDRDKDLKEYVYDCMKDF